MNKNKIQKAWEEYEKTVYEYAIDRFNKVVLPYLRRHKLSFVAGNGTYYIGLGKTQIYHEDLSKRIEAILEMEIPGMPGNSLGTLMPDYDPKE